MEKTKENLNFIFNNIFVAIMFYLLIISIFKASEVYVVYKEAHILKPIVLILSSVIGIGLILKYQNLVYKIDEKKLKIIIISICILIISIQIYYMNNFRYINYSDLGQVSKSAIDMMKNGYLTEENYLARYTNNIPLTIFLALVYKAFSLLGFENYKTIGMFINMLSIDMSIILMCLLIKNIYNIRKVAIILGFILINPMFYVYIPTYYTNSLSLIFNIALVFIYSCFLKKKYKKTLILLLGIVSIIGIKFRVTVAIVLIAILIHMIFNFNKKEFFKYISIIFICIAFGNKLYGVVEKNYIRFDYNEIKYPITHWIMMGAKGNGGYDVKDVIFTGNLNGSHEKLVETTKEAAKRIIQGGLKGNIERIDKKINRVWASGTYGFRQNVNNIDGFSKMYSYIIGDKSIFFNYYCQIIHIIILFLALIVGIKNYRNYKIDQNKIYKLIIFGGVVFYIIWEANPRYALMFIPFMMLLSVDGIERIGNLSKDVNKLCQISIQFDFRNVLINKQKILKLINIFKRSILLFIGILLMWNYSSYCKIPKTFYDWSVNQYQNNSKTEAVNGNIIVEQTFKTSNTFNTLELNAEIKDITNGKYLVKIIDNYTNKEMLNKEFNINEFDKKGNVKIIFDNIQPYSLNEYKVYICNLNQNDNKGIKLYKYYKSNNDVNPNGELYINGKNEEGDLTFKVYNEFESTFMKPSQYILLGIMVFTICIFSLYSSIKRSN